MTTLDSFLSQVREKAAQLHIVERRVWYRGLSNHEYTLLPSLFREPKGRPREEVVATDRRQRERNLFARFKTQAGQLMPSGLASPWEVLSVMQHYGVPTRMMDWTDSLFVALYFALEYQDNPPSPCLWLLNPFALNREALKRAIIFDQVDQLPPDTYDLFITTDALRPAASDRPSSESWPPQLPIATAPIWGHERARRQQGFFTIHGTDERPLEQQAKHLVTQIDIPTALQEPLRHLLREAGVDHYVLFHDLDGLARKLRQRYGWT